MISTGMTGSLDKGIYKELSSFSGSLSGFTPKPSSPKQFPITIKNLRTSAGTEDEEVLWAKVFPSRKFPARFVLQLFMGPISSAELTQAKKAFSSAVREFSIR